MWSTVDNHNYMCYICAKGFLDSNCNEAVIDKISSFNEIAPNFTRLSAIHHIDKNRIFSSIFGTFKTDCFFPINSERNLLFIVCQLCGVKAFVTVL